VQMPVAPPNPHLEHYYTKTRTCAQGPRYFASRFTPKTCAVLALLAHALFHSLLRCFPFTSSVRIYKYCWAPRTALRAVRSFRTPRSTICGPCAQNKDQTPLVLIWSFFQQALQSPPPNLSYRLIARTIYCDILHSFLVWDDSTSSGASKGSDRYA
jgi:hypothetical protein